MREAASGLSLVVMEDLHVGAERIREIVTKWDVFITDAEEAHVAQCGRCLGALAALVIRDDYLTLGDGDSS